MSLQKTVLSGLSTEAVTATDQVLKESEKTIERAIAIIETRWKSTHESICSPAEAQRYFKLKLSDEKQEVFSVLYLTSKHQVIAYEVLFRGTVDSSPVYPRVVAQKALEHNASALIVAHNHPSGVAEPSEADIRITKVLYEAMSVFNIKLLDHLIIGKGEPTSLAERGDLY